MLTLRLLCALCGKKNHRKERKENTSERTQSNPGVLFLNRYLLHCMHISRKILITPSA